MKKNKYKYIYGPVSSWRLDSSLGVDLVSRPEKICSFDCVYCQIGRTEFFSAERKIFVPTEEVITEFKSIPDVRIDYITFSGKGEPTLALNLGEVIERLRELRKEKIAVITNSSFLNTEAVREDLKGADLVMAKLDACSRKSLEKINNPMAGISYDHIISGIKEFRKSYVGKLALQIMFIEGNRDCAEKIADVAREIGPDEVQINTPLRKCEVKPLSEDDLRKIKSYFKGMNVISVYEAKKEKVYPMDKSDTSLRRGKP